MSQQIITEVFCTLQIEGTHSWRACPHEEVNFLRDNHRHIFNIKAYKVVSHLDRDSEFIILKHQIRNHFTKYYDELQQLHVFGQMSCEMIAEALIRTFGLSECIVDEDGENGSRSRVHHG